MVAAECSPNVETVIVHEVNLDLLRRHRQGGTVQNWNDRRTDFYALRYTEGDKERTVGVPRE
jgi:predicted amidohydrolase